MKIIEVINKENGRTTRTVYVDGKVFIKVKQPEEGFFGWKDGNFNISEVAGKAVELARIVNRARDLQEEVVIRTIMNIESVVSTDTNDFTREEIEFICEDNEFDFNMFMNWLIIAGLEFDWFEPEDIITQETLEELAVIDEVTDNEVSRIESVVEENDRPISVPMVQEAESNSHSYDSGSSYDSGGSSDCGGGCSCD